MGIIKKAAKGTLAVSTLGASVAVEKGAKAAAHGVTGQTAGLADLTAEERDAGIIFKGMSHDLGRNAEVTLYADRIERIKQRSRLSVSKAHQDVEMTPMRSVTSVQTKKDGFFTKVIVYAAANDIAFRFRHDAAQEFRNALQSLMLEGSAAQAVQPAVASTDGSDAAEQLRKLAELRDAGIVTAEEFETKKSELLQRI